MISAKSPVQALKLGRIANGRLDKLLEWAVGAMRAQGFTRHGSLLIQFLPSMDFQAEVYDECFVKPELD